RSERRIMMPSTQSSIAIAEVVEPVPERAASFWRDAVRRYRRNRLAVAGLIVVLAIIALAAGANLIAPQGYNTFNGLDANQFPSWSHIFGTDDPGRHEFAMFLFGARTALTVCFVTALTSITIGASLRALAGPRRHPF